MLHKMVALIRILHQPYCLLSWGIGKDQNGPGGPGIPDLNLPRSSVGGLISARTEKAQNSGVRRVSNWQRGRQKARGKNIDNRTKSRLWLGLCIMSEGIKLIENN